MTKIVNEKIDSELFLPFVKLYEDRLSETWRKFSRNIYYDKDHCFKMSCYASLLDEQIFIANGSLEQETGGDLGDIMLTYDPSGNPEIRKVN
jgi:hypothetical protein